LEHQQFFIRQHVGFGKLASAYDILDPQSQDILGTAREEVSAWVLCLRLVMTKQNLPTRIIVREADESLLFTIRRPMALFRARVEVYDAEDELVGYFQNKLLSLTEGFWVYDKQNRQFAEVKGDWKGWNFRFVAPDGKELGVIAKQWAGL